MSLYRYLFIFKWLKVVGIAVLPVKLNPKSHTVSKLKKFKFLTLHEYNCSNL